ncbi:hypothetical protein BH10PLA2_BH10PLA2_11930 [soil metagenome]
MIELTEHQRRALDNEADARFINPATHEEFVLVPSRLFERIKLMLADDWSEAGFEAAMEVFGREGWADPSMDIYDEMDPRSKS